MILQVQQRHDTVSPTKMSWQGSPSTITVTINGERRFVRPQEVQENRILDTRSLERPRLTEEEKSVRNYHGIKEARRLALKAAREGARDNAREAQIERLRKAKNLARQGAEMSDDEDRGTTIATALESIQTRKF